MKYAEQYVVSGIGMARWICVIIVNKTSFYLLTFFPQYRIILSKPAMQMPEQNDSLRLKCNEIEMVSQERFSKDAWGNIRSSRQQFLSHQICFMKIGK